MAVAKMVQEWFKENNNEFEVLTYPPDSPDLSLASAGCAGQTSLIHGGPTSQFTGPQHTFSKVEWRPYLNGSGMFWQQKEEQHNIRQVVKS